MNKPVIISFYTPNYLEEAQRFARALRSFDFRMHIEEVPDRGQWIDNVYYRAEFILEKRQQMRQDVVWIDIDGEVLRYPHLFIDFPGDFGAHFYTWPSGKKELLGGTMYFRFNERVDDLVSRWWARGKTEPKRPRSQLLLHQVVEEWRTESRAPVKIYELPEEYTYIPRFMPDVKAPVILHHQASGKYRRSDLEGFDIEEVSGEPKSEND